MRGVMYKTFRETWMLTTLLSVALFGVTAILTAVIPQVQDNLLQLIDQLPFLKPVFGALFGIDIDTQLTREIFQGAIWVQPLVMSLTWIHSILMCSRFPVAELERGTLDVLLGLPVSRRRVYAGESCVWVLSGVLVMVCALSGSVAIGTTLGVDARVSSINTVRIVINFFALYLAIGGMTCLASAMCDYRGRAIGAVVAIVLASFFLNFLAEIWEPAQKVAFLSVLQYYRPAAVISSGAMDIWNLAVLMVIATCTWVAGGEVVARRSLCTV